MAKFFNNLLFVRFVAVEFQTEFFQAYVFQFFIYHVQSGELFGNENDERFITLYKNKTERKEVPNLIKKSLKDEEVIRKILSNNKIYSIKVEKGIVVEHRLCLPMIPTNKVPVFTPETLKKHLNCGKYDIDYKINVGAILSAIENAK